MNDHIKPEILAYLAGELPASRNRQIEAHAASCEKCRNAISKARAKQARVKREALKKASPDDLPMPNLFLARQRKQAGLDNIPRGTSWFAIACLVVAVGGYWTYHKHAGVSADRNIGELPKAETLAEPPTRPDAKPSLAAPPPQPVAAPPKAPTTPTVLHVIEDWKGGESAIKESRLMVIRKAEDWQNLWSEMGIQDPLPPLDFRQNIVLGIFAGEVPAGTSIQLGRIEDQDEEVNAPYRFNNSAAAPAVEASTGAAPAVAPAMSHPYLLSVIPRVDKKIRLTQKEKRS